MYSYLFLTCQGFFLTSTRKKKTCKTSSQTVAVVEGLKGIVPT